MVQLGVDAGFGNQRTWVQIPLPRLNGEWRSLESSPALEAGDAWVQIPLPRLYNICMKTCRICGLPKALEEFGQRARTSDGRQSYCLECSRQMGRRYYGSGKKRTLERKKQNNSRYRERNKRIIEEAKKGRLCLYCVEDDPCCLDFHHLGNKKYSIADMPNLCVSEETLKAEIAKCELICSNCHRKLHKGRKLKKRGEGLLVSRLAGSQEAAGSTPASPTYNRRSRQA